MQGNFLQTPEESAAITSLLEYSNNSDLAQTNQKSNLLSSWSGANKIRSQRVPKQHSDRKNWYASIEKPSQDSRICNSIQVHNGQQIGRKKPTDMKIATGCHKRRQHSLLKSIDNQNLRVSEEMLKTLDKKLSNRTYAELRVNENYFPQEFNPKNSFANIVKIREMMKKKKVEFGNGNCKQLYPTALNLSKELQQLCSRQRNVFLKIRNIRTRTLYS